MRYTYVLLCVLVLVPASVSARTVYQSLQEQQDRVRIEFGDVSFSIFNQEASVGTPEIDDREVRVLFSHIGELEAQRDIDVLDVLMQYDEKGAGSGILLSDRELFDGLGGDLLYVDTDSDGVTDYAEEYLWNSSVQHAISGNDSFTDGESILKGIDPVSDMPLAIAQFTGKANTFATLTLTYDGEKQAVFSGRLLPQTHGALLGEDGTILSVFLTDRYGYFSIPLDASVFQKNVVIMSAQIGAGGKVFFTSLPIGDDGLVPEGELYTGDELYEVTSHALSDAEGTTDEITSNTYVWVSGGLFLLIVIIISVAINSQVRRNKDIEYQ